MSTELELGKMYIITKNDGWQVTKIQVLEVTKTSYFLENMDCNAKYRTLISDFKSSYKITEDLGYVKESSTDLLKKFLGLTDEEILKNLNNLRSEGKTFKDPDDPFKYFDTKLNSDDETLETANELHDYLIT